MRTYAIALMIMEKRTSDYNQRDWDIGSASAVKLSTVIMTIITFRVLHRFCAADGTAAPYKEDAQTRPLNTYGFLKLRGEYAALAAHPSPFILRIPVLYGPTTDLAESAVTTFAVAARNHDKPQTIDDWQIRVPTYTPDIGRTLVIVATTMVDPERKTADKVCGIFNYSASERFTRYQLVQYFGQLQGVSTDHITRDPNPPKGAPRPYDCQLDTSKLSALGLAAPCTPFDVACREILGLPSS